MARRRSKRRSPSRKRSRGRHNPLTRLSVKALVAKRNSAKKAFVKTIKSIDKALHEKGKRRVHDAILADAKAHAAKPRKPQLHLPNPWGA